MAEYISGEKHREMTGRHTSQDSLPKPLLMGIVVVVLMGLSFYGGIAYQKSKHTPISVAAANASGQTGGFGGRRFGNGQRPTFGQVTAISPTSLTVEDANSGTSTTLAITSTTQITDNGQTVTVTDIQTGDTVAVVASTSDKTQAARILVNPSFGGGGGSQGSSSGTSGSAPTN